MRQSQSTASHGRGKLICLLCAALLLVTGPAAAAYSTADGFDAHDYAAGFPESTANHWGPIGITFDTSDNLFVADPVDGNIYRFQPGGGEASSATRLTEQPIPGMILGMAISRSGDLYVARRDAGDVVQVDPNTGQVLRSVAAVPCATGLAVDPLSGDLFVSQDQCGSTIYRISGFSSGSGTATAYAFAHGVDGLAFDQSGTLYAESDGSVDQIDGTNSATPGAVTGIASVPRGDGLAFGAHTTGQPPFLVVNGNDGIVTRVDFGGGQASKQRIFSGGSRGDFAAVDSGGCLYITQTNSIVRISPSGSACAFEPSTRGRSHRPPAPGLVVTPLGSKPAHGRRRACPAARTLTLRLSQRGRVRLRSATIYVNGRRVRVLTGHAVEARIVLRRLPATSFRLTIVAVTTKGRKLVSRKSYASLCPPPPPRCISVARSLKLSVPQRRGTRAVRVIVYLNGRRQKTFSGRKLIAVTVNGVPQRFTVKLVVHYAGGASRIVQRSFLGCAAHTRRR